LRGGGGGTTDRNRNCFIGKELWKIVFCPKIGVVCACGFGDFEDNERKVARAKRACRASGEKVPGEKVPVPFSQNGTWHVRRRKE
jgi:hypothetical protein